MSSLLQNTFIMKISGILASAIKLSALFLISTCYLACHEVYFEQPQPLEKRALSRIPKDIRGLYPDEKDTLQVTATKVVGMSDEDYTLGENLIVKKFRGYYFMNLKDKDSAFWILYLVKPLDGKGLQLYMLDMDEEADRNAVKEITKVRATYDSEGKEDDYILNPSKREWKKLLERGLIRTDPKDGFVRRIEGGR